MNKAIVVSAFFVLTKGGLISKKKNSIVLNSLKEGAKKYPEYYPSEEKKCSGYKSPALAKEASPVNQYTIDCDYFAYLKCITKFQRVFGGFSHLHFYNCSVRILVYL